MLTSQIIQIKQFAPKYEDAVTNLIVPIQQTEFSIDITAEDQPDLKNIPGYYQKGPGNFWVAIHMKKMGSQKYQMKNYRKTFPS